MAGLELANRQLRLIFTIFSSVKARALNWFVSMFKNWAWDNRAFNVYDELYFLGKQVRHESMLFGKVNYIVTDAPVFMTAYYASIYCSTGLLAQGVEQAALAFYKQAKDDGHNHVHVYLNRNLPYKSRRSIPNGRPSLFK